MRHGAAVLSPSFVEKEPRGLSAASFDGSKTVVLLHSIRGTGSKVMRLEQKHIWQFSSFFHFSLNNTILVLVADTLSNWLLPMKQSCHLIRQQP